VLGRAADGVDAAIDIGQPGCRAEQQFTSVKAGNGRASLGRAP
jgi:hypothetical protein